MGDPALAADFARDIVLIKQAGVNPVVVHGGGPQIGSLLDRLNIRSEFRGGLRVTDRATVEVVEMVLAGTVNKEIGDRDQQSWRQGGRHLGQGRQPDAGQAARAALARPLFQYRADRRSRLRRRPRRGRSAHHQRDHPIRLDPGHRADRGRGRRETLNINADTFAAALASALKAKRLLLLTDVEGVLDKNGNLIKSLTTSEAQSLIDDGTISGGMIPKIESCIDVIAEGVEGVVIINGKVPHAVLLELFTEHGAGTLIERRRRKSAAGERNDGARGPARGFDHVEAWVFDLDNTLYPADCNLFAQIDRRMGEFIADCFGISLHEAQSLRETYYYEHGTTLAGLVRLHDVPPDDFLDYVHDIDLSAVRPPRACGVSRRTPGAQIHLHQRLAQARGGRGREARDRRPVRGHLRHSRARLYPPKADARSL